MLRKVLIALTIIGFFLGLGIFLYPHVSSWLVESKFERAIDEFEKAREDFPGEQKRELYEIMTYINEFLYPSGQSEISDAWISEQDSRVLGQEDYKSDVIGTIEIPRMEINLPIYLGATEEHMAKGIANLDQTSLPIGGINTNSVLVGHRGYKGAPFFRDIEDLQIGDKVIINNIWERLEYIVSGLEVIYPNESDKVSIQPGKDMVTLVTCHPYRNNYQRYVVYCERSEVSEEEVSGADGLDGNETNNTNQNITSSKDAIIFEKYLPYFTLIFVILLSGTIFIYKKITRR